jgi:hypothetical protein
VGARLVIGTLFVSSRSYPRPHCEGSPWSRLEENVCVPARANVRTQTNTDSPNRDFAPAPDFQSVELGLARCIVGSQDPLSESFVGLTALVRFVWMAGSRKGHKKLRAMRRRARSFKQLRVCSLLSL